MKRLGSGEAEQGVKGWSLSSVGWSVRRSDDSTAFFSADIDTVEVHVDPLAVTCAVMAKRRRYLLLRPWQASCFGLFFDGRENK